MKRLMIAALTAAMLAGCGGSSGPEGADCDALYQELDALRNAQEEKVISGVPQTDAEIQAYQDERARRIADYEAQCGPLGG